MNLNLAECLFVFLDVIVQRVEKQFRMLRSGNNAGMDFCFWDTGKNAGEIDHKFRGGVRDDCEV